MDAIAMDAIAMDAIVMDAIVMDAIVMDAIAGGDRAWLRRVTRTRRGLVNEFPIVIQERASERVSASAQSGYRAFVEAGELRRAAGLGQNVNMYRSPAGGSPADRRSLPANNVPRRGRSD